MPEVLVAPDIEAAALTYLTARLTESTPWGDDIPSVETVVPNPRPARFTRLALLNTRRRDLILIEATLGTWTWAPTSVQASRDARYVEGWLAAWRDHSGTADPDGPVTIYDSATLSGPSRTEDPQTRLPMYLATYLITCRARLI